MRRRAVGCLLAIIVVMAPALALAQQTEGEAEPEAVDAEVVPESTTDADEGTDAAAEEEEASNWWIGWFGYVRVAFENVQQDPNVDFVGRNDGFTLHNARIGVEGGVNSWFLSWVVSIDGAVDIRARVNDLGGNLAVRLRDAYLREDALSWLGFQAGQFKVPFSAEEMMDTAELMFASRAVGLEGVRVGRGYETPGIVIARQLGAMINPREPIFAGDFGVSYYFAMANGNGPNQVVNDNDTFAYYARAELLWSSIVRLGGSILFNKRTVGELPDLFDEEDFGYSADLMVSWEGLRVYGQITNLETEYPTTGNPERRQLEWHAQVGYRFDMLPVPLEPAYRYAYFHPQAQGGAVEGGIDLDSYQLQYHTFGLNIYSKRVPLTTYINYTLTIEEEPRVLENNIFEILAQVAW